MINNSQKIKSLILTTALVFVVLGISALAIFSFVGKDKFVIKAQVSEAVEDGKTETVGGVIVRKPFAVTEDPCPADTDWREGEFRSETVVNRDRYDFRDFPYIMWFDSNLLFINEISGERCLVEEHIMKKALRTPGHSDRVIIGIVSNSSRVKNLSDNLIFSGGIPATGGGRPRYYSYNLESREFSILEEVNRYHLHWRVSPDGNKNAGILGGEGDILYVLDLQTDSVLTEVRLNEGETLIKGPGMGGPFMEMNWVDDNTLEYTVFDESQDVKSPPYTRDPIETREVKIDN